MTKSQIFKLAHSQAAEDKAYDNSKPYAHYFRLRLLNIQANERVARTGMAPAFVVYERRLWA